MHPLIILNDQLVEAAKARVAPVSSAAIDGRGVFTNVAVYDGKPFLWHEHCTRLREYAARIGINSDAFDEARALALVEKIIAANKVQEGLARVTLMARAAQDSLWKMKDADASQSDLLIMTADARPHATEGVLALTVSPYRLNTLSPLVGMKSVNYLEHTLAHQEARGRDFDEAVMLNERGEIAGATLANIFWVKDGTVHTPALTTGAFAGTTRAQAIALAHDLSVPVVEGVNELHQLGEADEIFLTSATLGLALVTTFDFRRYTVPVGSVALRLHEAFRQLTLHAD